MSCETICLIISSSFTALATIAIACYTHNNNKIIKQLQKENQKELLKQQNEYQDLFLHIIASNISTPTLISQNANTLFSLYTSQYSKIKKFVSQMGKENPS